MKKFITLVTILLAISYVNLPARRTGVVFDNVTGTPTCTSGTSVTLSTFTIGSAADRILLVKVTQNDDNSVTGITSDGTPLSDAVPGDNYDGNSKSLYFYYLLAPATGTPSIVASATNSHFLCISAISFSGVAQTAPEAYNVFNGFTASPSASLTTVTANAIAVGAGIYNAVGAVTGTGVINHDAEGILGSYIGYSDAIASPGATSTGFSEGGASYSGWSVISLAPSAGGGGGSSNQGAAINSPIGN